MTVHFRGKYFFVTAAALLQQLKNVSKEEAITLKASLVTKH